MVGVDDVPEIRQQTGSDLDGSLPLLDTPEDVLATALSGMDVIPIIQHDPSGTLRGSWVMQNYRYFDLDEYRCQSPADTLPCVHVSSTIWYLRLVHRKLTGVLPRLRNGWLCRIGKRHDSCLEITLPTMMLPPKLEQS